MSQAVMAPRNTSTRRSHLSDEQRAFLEARLLKDRARALRNHGNTGDANIDHRVRVGGDFVDISNEIAQRENATLLASRSESLVRQIDHALDLLRNAPDLYGCCELCSAPIPFDRLDLLPTTRHCALHAQ